MSIRKTIIFMFLSLLILIGFPEKVFASSIQNPTDFENLSGDAEYLKEDWRENYYLDIEELGILDAGKGVMNDIANVLWQVIRFLAFIVVSVFYYAMQFDVSSMFSSQIGAIQEALNNSIFSPLFMLAFCGTALILIKRLIKRDMMGAIGDLAKVIGILILSILVVRHSSVVLSYATNITKGVSVDALTGINQEMGISGVGSFAADAAGVLWVNMVHEPWKCLEFGETASPTSDDIEKILTKTPGSEERAEVIKQYIEEHEGNGKQNFNKNIGVGRIGFLIVYLIPFIIKAGIYLLVALIQLAFQALAIGLVVLAPIVLLIALVPGYENMIPSWARKILENQVSIIIITFFLGILVKFDQLLFDMSAAYGWLMVLIFQIAIEVGLFLGRHKILAMLGGIQRGISVPTYARTRMMRSGNLYEGMERLGRNINKTHQVHKHKVKSTVSSQERGNSGINSSEKNPERKTETVRRSVNQRNISPVRPGQEENRNSSVQRPRSIRTDLNFSAGAADVSSPEGGTISYVQHSSGKLGEADEKKTISFQERRQRVEENRNRPRMMGNKEKLQLHQEEILPEQKKEENQVKRPRMMSPEKVVVTNSANTRKAPNYGNETVNQAKPHNISQASYKDVYEEVERPTMGGYSGGRKEPESTAPKAAPINQGESKGINDKVSRKERNTKEDSEKKITRSERQAISSRGYNNNVTPVIVSQRNGIPVERPRYSAIPSDVRNVAMNSLERRVVNAADRPSNSAVEDSKPNKQGINPKREKKPLNREIRGSESRAERKVADRRRK